VSDTENSQNVAGDADELSQERDAAGLPKDDERLSQDQIDSTGEPVRDRLGNQDGAS
jgi:hypothetical protein